MQLETGMLARSKAGRDKEHVYVVVNVENEYVYVADGKTRPLRHMKKKNRRHLQPIRKIRFDGVPEDKAVREVIEQYIREGKPA